MDYLPLILLAALWATGIAAFASALRTPAGRWEASGQSKALAIVGLLATCGVGGIYYWLRVQPALRAVAGATDHPPPRPSREPSPWDDGRG